jgi:hypothetical protein
MDLAPGYEMLIPDGGVQKKLIKQGEDGRTA